MANLEHAEEDQQHVKMSGEVSAAAAPVCPAQASSAPGTDPGPPPTTIPTFADASALLSSPYSCLVLKTHRRHITLPPMHLSKKRTGIQQELQAELLKFSESLKGVPLAYDNIGIVSQQGDIYDDSGYIHMDIEANFIVFQPKKGEKLLGMVNKLGVSHVGCLVHGCFNASIPKPGLVAVETWRDAGPRIGSELEFEVTALDADVAGVLLIRGRLERTRVQELLAIGESWASGVTTDQPDSPKMDETPEVSPEPTEQPDTPVKEKNPGVAPESQEMGQRPDVEPEPPNDSAVDTPKKKKKKKKKVKDEEVEMEVTPEPFCQVDGSTAPAETNGAAEQANGEEAEEKKKKKIKKEKHPELETVELPVSPHELPGSDSSGYISDKPSKKRKHETDVEAGFGAEPESPKSKKKSPKKKKIKSDVDQFA